MELYQLKSFVAVSEMRHLTRAAEKLHISQPALSAQIRALEDDFGAPLFERTSAGMVLTPAGRRLLPMAEKVLTAAQAMRNEARAIKNEIGGIVRIGTVSDPEFIRVAPFMSAAMSRHPLMEMEFHHVVTGEAFQRVRDGELDASFYYGDLSHADVESLPLCDFVFRVVMSPSWKDRFTRNDFAEVASQPWVVPPPISTLHTLIMQLFKRHKLKPTRVVEADHEAVITSLAQAGLGMALMREQKAEERQRNGEIMIWGDVRLDAHLQFIYAKERSDDPLIRALVEVIKTVWSIPA